MKILDSNIIIYSYQPAFSFLKPLVTDTANAISAITKVEVLGFYGLQPGEKTYCESVFSVLKVHPLDDFVIDEAIRLRRTFKMKIGDSLVAATALVYNAELFTRNITDFKSISGLEVINPIP